MQVRRVGMAVNQSPMKVAMAVGFLPVTHVFMPVMFIMNMPVLVKNGLMFVLMVVIFSH